MLEPIKAVNKNLTCFSTSKRVFRALQRHLDAQPVGFPRTPSGVELRIPSHMFTVDEARAALYLTYRHEPLQVIFNRVPKDMFSMEKLRSLLDHLDRKGSIFVKGEKDQYKTMYRLRLMRCHMPDQLGSVEKKG